MTFMDWLELVSAVVRLLNALIAPALVGASLYKWHVGNRELALYLAVLAVVSMQNGAS